MQYTKHESLVKPSSAKRSGIRSITDRSPKINPGQGVSIQKLASDLWHKKLSQYQCSSELIDAVSTELNIDHAVITGWVNLNCWLRPEDQGDTPDIDADAHLFSVLSDQLYQVSGIDRRMDPQALYEMATDPLAEFWCELRKAHRRQTMRWLENVEYVSVGMIDLAEVEEILERFPLTLSQVGLICCAETAFSEAKDSQPIFETYAYNNGLRDNPYAHASVQRVDQLIYRYESLQKLHVRYAQHLYRELGIPIQRLADFTKVHWRDLWMFGVIHGSWVLPESSYLDEVKNLIVNHNVQ